jgi:hypothetical protein
MRLPSFLSAVFIVALSALAQDISPVAVTPSVVTVLLGDSHPFRAVNREGRPAYAVRWTASSANVQVTGSGADAEAYFRSPGDYVINAYSPDGSGSARVKVVNWRDYPQGAMKWSVDSLPGCHTGQITPAIPAPQSTNDVFVTQVCPNGKVIRAFTADGLENWRTWISGTDVDMRHLASYEPKALLGKSLCDGVKTDMTREEVSKLAAAAKLELPDADKMKDSWLFEETAGECRITFTDGKVSKKQKIIAN